MGEHSVVGHPAVEIHGGGPVFETAIGAEQLELGWSFWGGPHNDHVVDRGAEGIGGRGHERTLVSQDSAAGGAGHGAGGGLDGEDGGLPGEAVPHQGIEAAGGQGPGGVEGDGGAEHLQVGPVMGLEELIEEGPNSSEAVIRAPWVTVFVARHRDAAEVAESGLADQGDATEAGEGGADVFDQATEGGADAGAVREQVGA